MCRMFVFGEELSPVVKNAKCFVLKWRKMLIADSIPLGKISQLPEKPKMPKYGKKMLEKLVRC